MYYISVKYIAIIFILTNFSSSFSCPLQKITYLTEDFPPYNFMVSGEVKGIFMDALIAASWKVNCPIKRSYIRLYPWPRAYKQAKDHSNTAIFAIVKTNDREPLFKWVGPLLSTTSVLIARKSRGISITNLKDLGNLLVGAVRSDAGYIISKSLGVNEQNFRFANHPDNLAKMLATGRVDLWSYDYITAMWILRKLKYEVDSFEVVKALKEVNVYFAFNKNTDDEAVKLLQKGLDILQNTPGLYGKSLLADIIADYQ